MRGDELAFEVHEGEAPIAVARTGTRSHALVLLALVMASWALRSAPVAAAPPLAVSSRG